ncbi:L-threonylcarbamoyladenylate synthase [Patescibacteria group bacterium]
MIKKIDLKSGNKKIIDVAVKILKNGGVIIYPTDTAYGMGCDACNQKAVEKIFKIKGRKKSKSLPVIVSSLKMAEKIFILNEKEKELAVKYLGKLSLVLKVKNDDIAKGIVANDMTVAVRVPNLSLAKSICAKLGSPIVSTSANFSGSGACYSVNEIKNSFKNSDNLEKSVDLIIDGGEIPKVSSSAIVRVIGDNVEVLREGHGINF